MLIILWWTDRHFRVYRLWVGSKCSCWCDWVRWSSSLALIFLNIHLSFSLYGLQLFLFPTAKNTRKSKGFLGKKRKLAITILSIAVPLLLVSLLAYMWLMKKRKTKGDKTTCIVLLTNTHTHIYLLISNTHIYIRSHLD